MVLYVGQHAGASGGVLSAVARVVVGDAVPRRVRGQGRLALDGVAEGATAREGAEGASRSSLGRGSVSVRLSRYKALAI